ncbi:MULTISPECIES: sugar transferase [Streptomyces]|uniref:sugar transferase n=1 Tax=Streptomyces TaxID=1883 RepID=UPI00211D217E|nr:sugar transferase [Streptomyces sp. or20]
MQNARKPRVRRKNQNRKDRKNRGRTPRPRSEPYTTEPRGPRPYKERPRPRPTVSGTTRGHFPSHHAARLAGLGDRAGRLADRFLPRTTVGRALDLILGTALLLLTAPAVAAAALALTARKTPGGAWHRRPRTGLGGRVFELRTLRTRRLRLDLFSRLPHVVRGELSLVGPAPLAPGDPRAAGPGARQWRQELRPGLTGLAQVRARSGMPWDDPALLDQHYAEHHGVVLDLAILAEAVCGPLRSRLRTIRRTKAHLSDTDHRPPGCSGVD